MIKLERKEVLTPLSTDANDTTIKPIKEALLSLLGNKELDELLDNKEFSYNPYKGEIVPGGGDPATLNKLKKGLDEHYSLIGNRVITGTDIDVNLDNIRTELGRETSRETHAESIRLKLGDVKIKRLEQDLVQGRIPKDSEGKKDLGRYIASLLEDRSAYKCKEKLKILQRTLNFTKGFDEEIDTLLCEVFEDLETETTRQATIREIINNNRNKIFMDSGSYKMTFQRSNGQLIPLAEAVEYFINDSSIKDGDSLSALSIVRKF